jgi:hypothetical protein
LPSYTITPIPKNMARDPSLVQKVKSISIETADLEFKEGTMPDSVRPVEGGIVFELGFAHHHEYETMEKGRITRKSIVELKRVPIVVLDSGFLFVGPYPSDIGDRLQSVVECNLTPGLTVSGLKFNEDILRTVIDSVPNVIKVDVKPSKRQEPDIISATRRTSVTETEFWAGYGSEPLDFVKVILAQIESEPRVGFRKTGVLTIHASADTFDLVQQAGILRHVADKILGPYLARTQASTFQTKLEGRQ